MHKQSVLLVLLLVFCAVLAYDSMYYEQDVMGDLDLNENFFDTNEHALEHVDVNTLSDDNEEQVNTLAANTANVTLPFQNSAPFVYGGTYMTRYGK